MNKSGRSIFKRLGSIIKWILMIFGSIYFVMIVLSFTSVPFWAYYRLGSKFPLACQPNYIIVMGAGGMPGPESLLRCHYGTQIAKRYPEAKIIIALPTISEDIYKSHAHKMLEEMVIHGIDSSRFLFETEGTNTREQAKNIAKLKGVGAKDCFLIITSPEHVFRSVKVFRKVGLENCGGLPSFSKELPTELLLSEDENLQKQLPPDRSPSLRYNMWNYLKLEISVLREYVAIVWYWLNGWI
ncbi:MAG: hypothetical protein BWX51_00620 [Bacteroidetes bacterium ADurb.Bin012]|nr:MAG: hypothetical protein BWX51_00620 [Bacteroidetes bacterium ADurb.Bin012]